MKCCGKSVVIAFEYGVNLRQAIDRLPDRLQKKKLWGAQCCGGDEWVMSLESRCRNGKALPRDKAPKPAKMYCGSTLIGEYTPMKGKAPPKCCGNTVVPSDAAPQSMLCCGDILVDAGPDNYHKRTVNEQWCVKLLWKGEETLMTHLNVGGEGTVGDLRARFQERFQLPNQDTEEHRFFADADAQEQLREDEDAPDLIYVDRQRA